MKLVALTGPPLVGKSTLFAMLTGKAPSPENVLRYPLRPDRAPFELPDPRLSLLCREMKPGKCTPARLEVMDLPGAGEGTERKLRNALAEELRRADLICLVVGLYGGAAPDGGIITRLVEEFVLGDLALLEGVTAPLRKRAMAKEEGAEELLELVLRVRGALEEGRRVAEMGLSPREEQSLSQYGLLSQKPLMVVANLGEDGGEAEGLAREAGKLGVPLLAFNVELEREIEELAPEEQAEFRAGFGIEGDPREQFAHTALGALGLICFYTVSQKEIRAWLLPEGATALEAAGTIHTDMAESFIKAQVIGFEELKKLHFSLKEARETGKLRMEGKDYPVRDGEIIQIMFGRHL